ncbi:hypothetical protein AAKU67_003652 [Oxalobacteraceae bacterium GrIS 2.11]
MRTTLSIDDDVLAAAKGLAERQHKTVGEVLSELARQALQPGSAGKRIGKSKRNGIPLLPVRSDAGVVTLEIVNQLRDDLN